ncbi:MAG: hypothetical protein JWN70_3108, partial [Planctomycetaceae bacterium]|nr:hypothetical protein [Planctomycetaceae bacterium]
MTVGAEWHWFACHQDRGRGAGWPWLLCNLGLQEAIDRRRASLRAAMYP